MKLIVVRAGKAVLHSEFGEHPVGVGDVVLLGANMPCGLYPNGMITVTTIYLDTDYVLDQLLWQYIGVLRDRLDARELAEMLYAEPSQVLRLGGHRAAMLMPWLDELVALNTDGLYRERFHRVQALWYSIVDQVAPFIRASPVKQSRLQRALSKSAPLRNHLIVPLRTEARIVEAALREETARRWTLTELAALVHLSTRQLVRIFTDAYGKTPLAYQTALRVERMALLMRNSDLTVAEAGRQVGWRSPHRAATAFQEHMGITPSRYRTLHR